MVDLRHMNSRLQLELATAAAEALSTISATPQQLVWRKLLSRITALRCHGQDGTGSIPQTSACITTIPMVPL
jgi:hypothetical protein